MKLEEIYRPVERELANVDRRLLEVSESGNKLTLEAVTGILKAGGKRLRPALVLMATKACGYSGERSIRLAVALELLHTTSLIHDDVVDVANLRRGIATINATWGNRISVLAGDYLYAKVVGMLAEDGDLNILRIVAATVAKMTDSEIAQTLCRHRIDVTEDEYLSMIAGKTASLMSCCCQVGAMLGTVHDGEIEVLANYGRDLGMAFQITDDLLDITGDQDKMGKPSWTDIRDGRLTLPFIRAVRVGGEEVVGSMKDAFGSGCTNKNSLTKIINMVQECGGVEHSIEKARQYGRACKETLKSLPESAARDSLSMLVDHVLTRVN